MSIDRSDRKASARKQQEKESHRNQASHTDQGFYRKPSYQPNMNLSSLSQKESLYDHKHAVNPLEVASDIGYTTLNPSQYGANAVDAVQEGEYEILAVFELNREREKNRILQRRLQNKEVHIEKMKEVHNQLTEAFENCQTELEYFRRKSSQAADVREYVEEISQLKHLVIRLEDKITEHERKESKRYNSVKNGEEGRPGSNDRHNISKFKAWGNDSDKVPVVKDKRSKTVANQQDSPEFKKLNIIEEYVSSYPTRITNFISQFMAMVQCFSSQAQRAKSGSERSNTKRRMKIGWKWIKEVVVEWNHLKNYNQKAVCFHSRLRAVFNITDCTDDLEIMELIMSAIQN